MHVRVCVKARGRCENTGNMRKDGRSAHAPKGMKESQPHLRKSNHPVLIVCRVCTDTLQDKHHEPQKSAADELSLSSFLSVCASDL